MPTRRLRVVLRHLRYCIGSVTGEDQSDRQLLDRFARQRDEAAFTALVRRHGPMVLGISRAVLHDDHAAEDVFQAVFLVLARKAAAVRWHESVGGWLAQVAYRVAIKARAEAARRQARERQVQAMRSSATGNDDRQRDVRAALLAELDRLPDKYRLPLVLCYLEGKTNDEAARELGWPIGSMSSRLMRGRELLRDRLAGRALALPPLAIGTILAETAAAALPAGLADEMARTMTLYAAGQAATSAGASAQAAALAQGMLQTMFVGRLTAAAVLLLALGTLSLGAGWWASRGHRPPEPRAEAEPTAGSEKADVSPAVPAPAPKNDRSDRDDDPLPPEAVARLGTARLRHGRVSGVAFLPDGHSVATVGSDGTIRLWDLATGKERRRFSGDFGTAPALAVSPDGRTLIATAPGAKQLRRWDLATGKELPPWKHPDDDSSFDFAVFAPDGKTLAVTGAGVTLVEADTGKRIHELRTNQPPRRGLAFSPDGRLLAAADHSPGIGPCVRVWDAASGELVCRLRTGSEAIASVAVRPGGKQLAAAACDGTVRLWDIATGNEVWQAEHPRKDMDIADAALTVAFAPDGKTLFSGGTADTSLRQWDAATGRELRPLPGQPGGASCLALAPDGKTIVAAGENGCVQVWNCTTGEAVLRPEEGHGGTVFALHFTADGRTIISAASDNTLRRWDVATGQQQQRRDVDFQQVSYLVFAADGRTLLAPQEGGPGRMVLDLDTGQRLSDASAQEAIKAERFAAKLYLSPLPKEFRARDRLFAAYAATITQMCKSGAGGKELEPLLTGQRGERLAGLVLGPDSRSAAVIHATGAGRIVRVWDLATRKLLLQLPGIGDGGLRSRIVPDGVAYSRDGKLLAVVLPGSRLELYEAITGQRVRAIPTQQGGIGSVAFSPDGTTVATGGLDTTILLWTLADRRASAELSAQAWDQCWANLRGDNAAAAHRAVWALVSVPRQSVARFRTELRPVQAPAEQLAKLIRDLENDQFETRQQASQELERLGIAARAALEKVLADKPALEVRRRVEAILEKGQKPEELSPERLRDLRAVLVLERIGTQEARQVLATLAQGVAAARLTQEAQAALDRLAGRRLGQD